MHLPDGFIDVPTSAGALALAVPAVALAARRSGRHLAERDVPLAGLVTAYLVVAQLLVFPIGLGTSGHLVGAGLALVLVGPSVAITCTAIVLVLQALLFADGGVSALGLNALNSGIVPILAGWAVLAVGLRVTSLRRVHAGVSNPGQAHPHTHARPGALPLVAGLAAGVGVVAGVLAFCAEYAIGATATLAPGDVARAMIGSHLVVGAMEGTLTGLLLAALLRVRPDLVGGWMSSPRTPHAGSADLVEPGVDRPGSRA